MVQAAPARQPTARLRYLPACFARLPVPRAAVPMCYAMSADYFAAADGSAAAALRRQQMLRYAAR